MKKTAIFALLIALSSCSKKDDPKVTVTGKWCMVEDTTRCFDVVSVSDSVTQITFEKQIASPKAGPITIPYKTTAKFDSTFCQSGTIYPPFVFVGGNRGYVAEWLYNETQGKYKPLIRK